MMLHPFHQAFEEAMYEASRAFVDGLGYPDSDYLTEVLEDAMRAFCGGFDEAP